MMNLKPKNPHPIDTDWYVDQLRIVKNIHFYIIVASMVILVFQFLTGRSDIDKAEEKLASINDLLQNPRKHWFDSAKAQLEFVLTIDENRKSNSILRLNNSEGNASFVRNPTGKNFLLGPVAGRLESNPTFKKLENYRNSSSQSVAISEDITLLDFAEFWNICQSWNLVAIENVTSAYEINNHDYLFAFEFLQNKQQSEYSTSDFTLNEGKDLNPSITWNRHLGDGSTISRTAKQLRISEFKDLNSHKRNYGGVLPYVYSTTDFVNRHDFFDTSFSDFFIVGRTAMGEDNCDDSFRGCLLFVKGREIDQNLLSSFISIHELNSKSKEFSRSFGYLDGLPKELKNIPIKDALGILTILKSLSGPTLQFQGMEIPQSFMITFGGTLILALQLFLLLHLHQLCSIYPQTEINWRGYWIGFHSNILANLAVFTTIILLPAGVLFELTRLSFKNEIDIVPYINSIMTLLSVIIGGLCGYLIIIANKIRFGNQTKNTTN